MNSEDGDEGDEQGSDGTEASEAEQPPKISSRQPSRRNSEKGLRGDKVVVNPSDPKRRGRPPGKRPKREPTRRSSRAPIPRLTPQDQAIVKPATALQTRKQLRKKTVSQPKPAEETGKQWEVEEIIDSGVDADTLEHFYHVKWKGYSSKHNTWEPKVNLVRCHDAIEAFETQKQSRK